MHSVQTPIKIACFAAFRYLQGNTLQGILRTPSRVARTSPTSQMKRTSARNSCLLLYLICPTLTSGVTQNMFRKSICLSALLALGMVGSSFAQNLTDSAQAQVGTNPDSSASGAAQAVTPQLIHSVPSELVADDSTGPNAIAGNPGGVANVISVPNFTRSFTVNGVT